MLPKAVAVALATTLVFAAPAGADEPSSYCDFASVQQDTQGPAHEGLAYGYAAHAEGGGVTIRCVVRVNGAVVPTATTPAATGDVAAVTYGPVSFVASTEDEVALCTEVATSHGTVVSCRDSESTQVPPQEVIDVVDGLFDWLAWLEYWQPPGICDLLRLLRGDYVAASINDQGDVVLAGELFFDCPPYEV